LRQKSGVFAANYPQKQRETSVISHLPAQTTENVRTSKDHYQRYTAVIHLVTAADGAAAHYTRWPDADRPERIEDAIRLDSLLHQVWRAHPRYYRLDNEERDWQAKSEEAQRILSGLV
jgi:hypothetical protein